MSRRVDFTMTLTRCRKVCLAVPVKAIDMFGLALQGLDVLREGKVARARITELEASGAEQLAKCDTLESHVWGLPNENELLEHELVTNRVEKERHEVQDVESTKVVTETKFELANTRNALCVLEGWASGDRPAVHGAIKDGDLVQGNLATTSTKLQVV